MVFVSYSVLETFLSLPGSEKGREGKGWKAGRGSSIGADWC